MVWILGVLEEESSTMELLVTNLGSNTDLGTPKKSAIFCTFPGIGKEVPFTYPVNVLGGIPVARDNSACLQFLSDKIELRFAEKTFISFLS